MNYGADEANTAEETTRAKLTLYHKAIYLIINWYVPQKASNEYCIRIRLLIATL